MATAATPVTQWDASGAPINSNAPVTQWDASGNPIHAPAQPAPQAQPQAPAKPKYDFTSNPNGEGVYRFVDMNQIGHMVGIDDDSEPTPEQQRRIAEIMKNPPVIYVPYSKALAILGHPEQHIGPRGIEIPAFNQGNEDAVDKYGLSIHKDEAERILRDVEADPNRQNQGWKNTLLSIPAVQATLGFLRGGAKTVSGADNLISKVTGKPNRTAPERAIQDFSENPVGNPYQGIRSEENTANYLSGNQTLGNVGEDMAEFMSGEGLLSKIGKLLGSGVKLTEAAKVEEEIRKGTPLGKLALQAIKQGTVAGGQTYVKTGGDTEQAVESGVLAGGLSGVTSIPGEIMARGGDALSRAASEAGQPSAEQLALRDSYAQASRGAVEPHLREISYATPEDERVVPERTIQRDTGLVDERGNPLMHTTTIPAETPPRVERLNVDEALSKIRTLGDARDALQAAADPIYERANELTGGAFRQVKAQLAHSESPMVRAELQKKLTGMLESLNANGQMSTEEYTAAKNAFRQMFVLDDIATSFDKSWLGNPGATKIGNAYNGINGKSLLTAIRNARIKYGDVQLTQIFGSDRLVNMEEQAALNVTQQQRRFYGEGLNKIAEYIQQKDPQLLYHFGAAGIGGAIAHHEGLPWYLGAAAGVGIELSAKKLAEVMIADPKIGQNFAFAIRAGARPENYVPMIASMLRQASEESAEQERQHQQQGTRGGGNGNQ